MLDTNQIRIAMLKKGMTQSELAKKMGIGTTTLSLKMNNKRDFTISEVVTLAKVLDVETKIFLESL